MAQEWDPQIMPKISGAGEVRRSNLDSMLQEEKALRYVIH
jgi:hypothetical protein